MTRPTTEVLQSLRLNRSDPSLLKELLEHIASDPDEVNLAVRGPTVEVAPLPVKYGFLNGTWANCIGNQVCTPAQIPTPEGLDDLVTIVTDAASAGLGVRVVGSGHSFSDVAVSSGVLIDPQFLTAVLTVDGSVLRDPAGAATLFCVESGIGVAALNDALADRNLALVNMGAYNGQTIIGAISTGTHGTGVGLGPLASAVASLVMVGQDGTVYQIEPAAGITDPTAFQTRYPTITLVQNDDWFQSVVVSMGCLGVVYSLTLQVMGAYLLEENRVASTWETMKPQLLACTKGTLPAVLAQNRHYEIDIAPYVIQPIFGPLSNEHDCIVTTRNIPPGVTEPSGTRGVANFLAGLMASWKLAGEVVVALANEFPALIPRMIESGLHSMVDSNYIDWSYKVLDLGLVNNVAAFAVELAFPIDLGQPVPTAGCVAAIDALLALLASHATGAGAMYQTGPLGVRFVAGASAYLAPQYAAGGAQGNPTCTVELDMLVGTNHGYALLSALQTAMYSYGARVHWGLDLDTLTANNETASGSYPLSGMYPRYGDFMRVLQELNSSGRFDNAFTVRVGFSGGGT